MTRANWNIWSVGPDNDALLTAPLTDAWAFVSRTASSVAHTLSPTALAAFDNTAALIRQPIKTIGTAENYGKLAYTLPAAIMDIVAQAGKLPFSRLDDAVQFILNNNIERWVEAIKGVSTTLLANIISKNKTATSKFWNGVATWVEWAWDIVWTLLKALPGGLGVATSFVDSKLAKATTWTGEQVASVRISDKSILGWVNILKNSSDRPEAANSNRKPVIGANDNVIPAAEAA